MTGRVTTALIGASMAFICFNALSSHGSPVLNECPAAPPANFRSLSRSEVERLIEDVAAENPKTIELLREDPESRKAQLENLRQLLAFASQAIKDGLVDGGVNCSELSNIRDEIVAAAYDKHLNKARPPRGRFGYINAARVSSYWRGTPAAPLSENLRNEREAKFQRFLDTKMQLLARNDPGASESDPSDDETAAAREFFAKTQIYASEYEQRSATLPAAVRERTALQVKLQQAQFLASLFADVAAEKTIATEDEVAAYLSGHKELSAEAQRAKAEEILTRAKNGEDFAKLANEFSQDPGNKGSNDELHGGSYRNVSKGTMVKPFESAALSLEAGQVYPAVVESDFGFHIIKLDRKDPGDSGTYDVRHILISTTVPDPENPGGREVPVKAFAKARVEDEKQERFVAEIVKANEISMPADFALPAAKSKAPARRTVRKR